MTEPSAVPDTGQYKSDGAQGCFLSRKIRKGQKGALLLPLQRHNARVAEETGPKRTLNSAFFLGWGFISPSPPTKLSC